MFYFVVAYLLLDWTTYLHPVLPIAVTPWNPSPGLALAFLLLAGTRHWPWVFIAAFAAELLVREIPLPLIWKIAAVSTLVASYTGLAWFLTRWARIDIRLRGLRDQTWLVAGALLAPLVAGLTYVGVYTAAGVAAAGDFPGTLLRFWIGDATGLLIVTPLLLTWTDWRERLQAPRREVWLQAGSVLLALWVIFGIPFTDEFKFFYLLYLPVVWVATRHGLPGTTLVLAVIQAGIVAALLMGGDNDTTVMEFQMLMLGLSVTGLFLGGSVAERQSAEERLHRRQAELNQALRLAAAGEMAQAVAHELNQPLSALANYSRASRAMLDGPEHAALLAQTLEKVEREATRAGEVVRRLREFFRGGVLRLENLKLTELIEQSLSPARRRAERQGVEIRLALDHDIPTLRVDRVQIGMVLHNLVANALDALRDADNAARWIEVSARLEGADWARLCVSDGGPGIVPEMRARLFESFATSKPEGMGLGLSISRTLVEAHGGRLWLEGTHPTRFCFTLPVNPDTA